MGLMLLRATKRGCAEFNRLMYTSIHPSLGLLTPNAIARPSGDHLTWSTSFRRTSDRRAEPSRRTATMPAPLENASHLPLGDQAGDLPETPFQIRLRPWPSG
jgi:hypothetical protein